MKIEEKIKCDMELGKHIYIYGAGSLATDIYRIFTKLGIVFSGAIVDDEYYESSKKLDGELDVIPASRIPEKGISVIAGNADYERIRSTCVRAGIENVYYLSRISYGTIGMDSDITKEYPIDAIDKVRILLSDEISVRNLHSFIEAVKTNDVEPILNKYKKQGYFDNDVFSVNKARVFCDIGAYTGDTIRDYLKSNYKTMKRIYAFEGNPVTYDVLRDYIDSIPDTIKEKIQTYNICLWDDVKRVSIGTLDEHQSQEESLIKNDENGTSITATLDSVLENREVLDLLKVNFLGSYNVLKGAERIIREDAPDIIAAVGFSPDDLLRLPIFIDSFNIGYRIYLRYNYPLVDGLVLYCTVK